MKINEKKAKDMSLKELARYIDYSVLKPEFTPTQIINLTKDGVNLGCATICINPGYVELCKPYVENTETMLCPVVDFPFGTSSIEAKIRQIEIVAKYDVVKEIDVVTNFGMIRAGEYAKVEEDIKQCTQIVHKYGKEIKIIFETDALTEEQIRKTCRICIEANADFVKTSTGFLTGFDLHGATIDIIRIIKKEISGKCKIKGSGCICTRQHFLELIDMGIDRMGIGYKSVPVVLNLK